MRISPRLVCTWVFIPVQVIVLIVCLAHVTQQRAGVEADREIVGVETSVRSRSLGLHPSAPRDRSLSPFCST